MSTKTAIIILSLLFIISIIGVLTYSYFYIWSPQPAISPAWKAHQQQKAAEEILSQEAKIQQMTKTLVDMASTTNEAVSSETEAKIQQMSETMSQMVPETISPDAKQAEADQTVKKQTMSDIMKRMVQ